MFKWLWMREWHLCEAMSEILYLRRKKILVRCWSDWFLRQKLKKYVKTFQDIWLYIFEITRRYITILKCEVLLFRHVERYEHQTLYPGLRLLPLRNEPIFLIWVTGNIFQNISSKSSKRIMQYHEHCRSREIERKNNHSK